MKSRPHQHHSRGARQPAAMASCPEQNQRSPLPEAILVRSYQHEPGAWQMRWPCWPDVALDETAGNCGDCQQRHGVSVISTPCAGHASCLKHGPLRACVKEIRCRYCFGLNTRSKVTGTARAMLGRFTTLRKASTPAPRPKSSAFTTTGRRALTASPPSASFTTATGTV